MSQPIHTIRQTVAAGGRFATTTLPTLAAVVKSGRATYPSSAQGGAFIFGTAADGPAPPKDGDTYAVRNQGACCLQTIRGNAGDATTLKLYIGREGALRYIATADLGAAPGGGNAFAWSFGPGEQPIDGDEIVALVDSGGGTTLARNADVVTSNYDGSNS